MPFIRQAPQIPGDFEATCLEVLLKYGADTSHARKVADLAGQIFDELAPLHHGSRTERDLLVAAALLHDVGHLVGERDHHRHSRYLIRRDSLLGGWSPEARDWVGILAANHRKVREVAMKKVPKPVREAARLWTSILRIADVLDRDHRQEARIWTVDIPLADARLVFQLAHVDLEAMGKALPRKAAWGARIWNRDIVFACGALQIEVPRPPVPAS
ncbi:MAG: HD domain-containing protein [Candidatus Sericytochromatia bacterium]|nr:HD domain-containing protein [Candidatus Sericytochromatia bacterium]